MEIHGHCHHYGFGLFSFSHNLYVQCLGSKSRGSLTISLLKVHCFHIRKKEMFAMTGQGLLGE